MVDVFISYSKTDKDRVAKLAQSIEAEGYAVWWDEELPPHQSYGEVITEKIETAKAAIVVWSASASKSEWVRAEADAARNQRKLIQTTLSADMVPPMPFNQIQCADLSDWNGESDHPAWRRVKTSLVALCGEREPPAVETPEPAAPEPAISGPAAAAATTKPTTPPPAPPAAQGEAASAPPPRMQTLMGAANETSDSGSTPNPGHPSSYKKGSGNNMLPLYIAGGIGAVALVGAIVMSVGFGGEEPDPAPTGIDPLVNLDDNGGDLGKPADDEFAVNNNGYEVPPPVAQPDNSQSANTAGFSGDGYNRDVTLINQSGEVIMYLQWSNVSQGDWGPDQLGTSVMGDGQNWFVTVDDGTGACEYDFRALTASERSIERRNVNVCQVATIYFN